jgi:hypothetical protein
MAANSFLENKCMRIYFESNKETKTFLILCRLIGKIIEENEKLRK